MQDTPLRDQLRRRLPLCCVCSLAGKQQWKSPVEVQELAVSRGIDPQRSPPPPAALRSAGRIGLQSLGGTGGLARTLLELLLAWPGTSGLLVSSRSAGWLQGEAEPTQGNCLAPREGAPGLSVPGATWKADGAQHPHGVPTLMSQPCDCCCRFTLAEIVRCHRAALLPRSVRLRHRFAQGGSSAGGR